MATTTQGSQQPKLFARQASGLIREFGFFDTFVFNTLAYALGLTLATVPFMAGSAVPEFNIVWLSTVGVILAIFSGVMFGQLASTMPRSGGDYVYNGRIIHPAVGFMTNFGFTCSQFLGIAIYLMWTVNYATSGSASTLGYAIKNDALLNLGTYLADKWPTFIFGTVALITVVIIQMFGMKFLKMFLNWLFGLAILGSVVTFFVFLFSDHNSFVAAFNSFMQSTQNMPDAYNTVIQTAKSEGFAPGTLSVGSVIMAMPLAYWIFLGFSYSVYIGGEVKEPQKTQGRAIMIALVVGYVIYTLTTWAYYRTVGTDFNNAAAFLQTAGKSPLPVAGTMNFFAGLLTDNWLVNGLMAVSFFLWFYLLLFVMFTAIVRNMFAWAFDQVMPTWLTEVTQKNRVPWVGIVVTAIVAEILLWAATFTSLFNFIYNYVAMFSIAYIITSISAVLLPYRRKDLYTGAPASAQWKVAGIPAVAIAGFVNIFVFGLILYASFTNAALGGAMGNEALIFVVGVYVVGVIIYYVSSSIRARKGVDFNLLYGEIPPE